MFTDTCNLKNDCMDIVTTHMLERSMKIQHAREINEDSNNFHVLREE